jgi:hypothetical protein
MLTLTHVFCIAAVVTVGILLGIVVQAKAYTGAK